MAKNEKPTAAADMAEDAVQKAPQPEPTASAPAGVRLLVNPSGNVIEFNAGDVEITRIFESRPPPGVAAKDWYREPTPEEASAFWAKHGK